MYFLFFFFNDTATTEIYTLSLHDALPIYWWPMSYSSLTGLVYIPTTDRRAGTKAAVEAGEGGEGLFGRLIGWDPVTRSEEHTSELQSPCNLVCRLLLEKKKKQPCSPLHLQ